MTDGHELQPDVLEYEEQENQLSKDDDNDDDNVSQLSVSAASEIDPEEKNLEEQTKDEELLPEVHNQIDEVLHIREDEKDDDLAKFIKQAQQQGFNCLDLSKKNISEFPAQLLDFPALQYLYLEGNEIAKLPDDLFVRLPNLKWIDLRNNKITKLPGLGLDKNTSLRYLLLSGNLIRTLPLELGKVKGLSALNLDGNPLDHPPLDVVKHGIKAIQQYLRDEHLRQSKCSSEKIDSDNEFYEEDQQDFTEPDVWASSDDDNEHQQRIPRKPKPLIKKNNQPTKTISNDPVGDIYVARAQEEQRLRRLKHHNMKITEELEKVKSKELLHEWKEDYRTSQQQLRRKRLVKGKDYPEAVAQAPFGIDANYASIMDKDQQEFVEKAIRYESRRNRSPEAAMREEEERRNRDRQVQDRIREITGKIMRRRGEVRGNAFDEKRQAEVELRELRKLEAEIKQRRTQIDGRFKAYTGDVKARKRI